MPTKSIREVLQKHTKELMAIPGVVGAGEGVCDGKPCIRVFISGKNPQVTQKIPASIEGYVVTVEETGDFKAL